VWVTNHKISFTNIIKNHWKIVLINFAPTQTKIYKIYAASIGERSPMRLDTEKEYGIQDIDCA